jgi:hypothetical protein
MSEEQSNAGTMPPPEADPRNATFITNASL